MQSLDDGSWLGGGLSEIVAIDARNATAISLVSYSTSGTNTVRILVVLFSKPLAEQYIVAHILRGEK